MSASSSPRSAEKVRQKQDERDSSESEDNELEIDDALLDQMLWKAERLANEMKLLAVTGGGGGSQQRDSCSEASSSSPVVNPCYSTVPNSIELDRSQEDAGTECSSVGGWLHTQEFRSDVATIMAEEEETGVHEMDKTSERSPNVMTPEERREETNSQTDNDEEMKSSSEHSRDNSSCNILSQRNVHSLAIQADADISAALKAAHLMKMQLEAVLIDSSQSGGSEENMDSSTSEEDNNSDDGDVLSFDNETHVSSALEALTPEGKERMGRSAAKQLTVPQQITEDDTVPFADYTRTNTVKPVFEKVQVAAEGDQDYVPIQDYSMAPNKKGVPLREFTFSESHAVVIRKRRFRRRQRRLAVLALFFVTVVGYLLSRRLWGAVPSTAPEAKHDSHKILDHQNPMSTTAETITVAQEVGETSEVAAQLKEIQDSDVTSCLLPFSAFFSVSCRSSMHLNSAPDKARARAKRREAVENLLQIMME